MRLIKHLQTECILSPELVIILKPNMASQQGDPGIVWGAIGDEDGQYLIPMAVNEQYLIPETENSKYQE